LPARLFCFWRSAASGAAHVDAGCTLARVTTWDYTTTVVTHGFLGRKEEELDRKEFETALNELGAQGFELATVFLDVGLHREKDGHVLVFKRRAD
jgi:Domain of unknown function (DUF4177)